MALPTGTATVTAKYGPGKQATAKVISNIKSVVIDIERSVLSFHNQQSDPSSPAQEFDLVGVTTFTVTISGVNFTFTVS